MAKEDNLAGYQETFSEFIASAKNRDHCVGPCAVDYKSTTSLSLQLWPHAKHCLHTCTDKIKPLFDLLDVKNEDRSVFYNKAQSIDMLLRQLTSTASKSFQCNNIHGSDSDDIIDLEDSDVDNELKEANESSAIDKDDLVARKIQQFALDMNSDRDENSEDVVVSGGASSEEEVTASTPIECNENKIQKATAKRHEDIDKRNKSIMRHAIALLECNRMSDLSELAIEAMSALDNIERGSLKDDKKVKSFLGRWYEKVKINKDERKDNGVNEILIERDRIITCEFDVIFLNEETKENEKREMKLKYRVLSVYTKQYNKWFMTSEKQPWNQFMKEDELKKYRCAVRMVVEGAFEGYEDVALNSVEWPQKHICKLISGLEIANVHNDMYNY